MVGAITTLAVPLLWFHRHVVAPFLARPIARKVMNEIEDVIEVIVMDKAVQQTIRESVEQYMARESQVIIRALNRIDARVARIEAALRWDGRTERRHKDT